MENLQATKLARKIIREEFGFTPRMWTNRFPKCRTVKAYVDGEDLQTVAEIRARVEATIPGASVKVIPGDGTWMRPLSSMIVRIPR